MNIGSRGEVESVPPRLTAEAFAELINAPGYEQLRIIHEQKYPKRAPAVFRIPYYNDAMNAIRRYYRAGNDLNVITEAIIALQSVQETAKTRNNVRVLEAFRDGILKDRQLTVLPRPQRSIWLGNVEIRFRPDLYCQEGDVTRCIVLNPRRRDATDELARMTLEIGCHILNENGLLCTIRDFEYINLISNQVVRAPRMRKRTLERARDTAAIVERLWDTI